MKYNRKTTGKKPPVLLFIFILILGLGLMFFGYTQNNSQKKKMDTFKKVSGKVTELYKSTSGSKTGHANKTSYYPIFTYTVDGVDYTVRCQVSSTADSFKLGSTGTIMYNPDDPSDSFVLTKTKLGDIFMMVGGFFTAISLVIMLVIFGKPDSRISNFLVCLLIGGVFAFAGYFLVFSLKGITYKIFGVPFGLVGVYMIGVGIYSLITGKQVVHSGSRKNSNTASEDTYSTNYNNADNSYNNFNLNDYPSNDGNIDDNDNLDQFR